MAETPTEITVDLVVPIYTRFNGKEIELGTYPVSVPMKVEIGVGSNLKACGTALKGICRCNGWIVSCLSESEMHWHKPFARATY